LNINNLFALSCSLSSLEFAISGRPLVSLAGILLRFSGNWIDLLGRNIALRDIGSTSVRQSCAFWRILPDSLKILYDGSRPPVQSIVRFLRDSLGVQLSNPQLGIGINLTRTGQDQFGSIWHPIERHKQERKRERKKERKKEREKVN